MMHSATALRCTHPERLLQVLPELLDRLALLLRQLLELLAHGRADAAPADELHREQLAGAQPVPALGRACSGQLHDSSR